MCQDCGCAVTPANVRMTSENHSHPHPHHHHTHHDYSHPHPHHHDHSHHDHSHPHPHHDHSHQQINLHQAILSKNDRLAERNRGFFAAKNLFVLNILSSPGSGKTALLERTLMDLSDRLPAAVIVGDLETDNDAQRLRRSGQQAIQIMTESLCHLEAEAIAQATQKLDLTDIKLLIIENVGNLVCPAAYDLGETQRVVLLSTTEGEDKPLKYPTVFKSADVVILNKIDIAEVVGFDRDRALENIRKIAPQAQILEVSARTGEGMAQWYEYLQGQVTGKPGMVNRETLTVG
ncbi:hydrogenase nickel incorporation protein HypB [Phormidium yuhuli AB48]|uniref:Hydrogenase nickel incorporation protein HypB n=1 Tax=Phormidium yuhuli AB48 TaxID=2940671 RepID=A0ABY5ATT9_9CYAN|nr:hydrogenase nickel incorporation protein HypB [Phormidium yuhuli]USR91659.1 hydrogenase nickel incorporation protein HypB [Phormidium yuhuli AB48]